MYIDIDIMRAPSLLSQCLPGLAPDQSISAASDREMHMPSPAVEIVIILLHILAFGILIILPETEIYIYICIQDKFILFLSMQMEHPYKYGHLILSVSDMIGSELIPSKTDGSFKLWDTSFELVNVLKHEIRDAQLSFRGKRVLELGCGYGLPGIFACLKGASVVHFQDSSAENIRTTTIPNVMANLEPESSLTPSRQIISPVVNFYAGEWEELANVLSVVESNLQELPKTTNVSFTEDDFMDGCSSLDGSIMGQEHSSTKLSGSRVWERANETDQGEGGYDIIMMTDIPYPPSSLKKWYALIKKCLKPPYGVLFVSAKKHYVGFNSAARQLRSLVDEEGVYGAHLIKEITDREIWKFFLK